MLAISTTRRRGLMAAACLLGAAMSTAPALAQKTKVKSAPVEQTAPTAAPAGAVTVEIPTINSVAANISDTTLRDIFSGNLVDNADALAGLTATSITIPTIMLKTSTVVDGKAIDSSVSFKNVVFDKVVDGLADTVTIGGLVFTSSADATGNFGLVSARNVDIGGLLRLYGLVDAGGQTAMATLYTDFSFAGGSITAPDVDCTLGAAHVAELKGRPIKSSFSDLMAISQSFEAQGDSPSPELIGKALHIYADLFTAIQSSPMQFDGLACKTVDTDNNPVDFSIAGMTMSGMKPGIYPEVNIKDLVVGVPDDGSVSASSLTFKAIDLSAPIAAIEAAPAAIDQAWFTANGRSLIPAFAGFSISGVSVDLPDPDNPGGRIVGGLGALDLTLANYVNGVPTSLVTKASNIQLDLPAETQDEQLQTLMSLGVSSIDAGFNIDANWDEASNTIAVNEISVTGVNLATIALSGTINNATDALFSGNENAMMAAAMGLAVGKLRLSIDDMGLSDIIMSVAATEQGVESATLRPVFAGLAEGTIVGALAGVAEAQSVGSAVSAFVAGRASQLTIDLKAKASAGIGLIDLMAAQEDPASIVQKLAIKATAQ